MTITGGLHADGFMDTMDAIHSYQPKERKLEILKDSLIGAFAVIMLAVYGLICLGALSEIGTKELQKLVCSGFFLSRCLSGISAVSFPLAKKDGSCPEEEVQSFLHRNDNCIIISDEIGNGIVPVEAFEREYRERTGRILIQLAQKAEEVERVICGIGQKIK